MNDFAQMHVFFFVSSVGFGIIFILGILIMYKILRILNHIDKLAELAGKEAERLHEDISYVRGRLLGLLDGLFSLIPRPRKKKADVVTKSDVESQ